MRISHKKTRAVDNSKGQGGKRETSFEKQNLEDKKAE